jgi:hypothetical protein
MTISDGVDTIRPGGGTFLSSSFIQTDPSGHINAWIIAELIGANRTFEGGDVCGARCIVRCENPLSLIETSALQIILGFHKFPKLIGALLNNRLFVPLHRDWIIRAKPIVENESTSQADDSLHSKVLKGVALSDLRMRVEVFLQSRSK